MKNIITETGETRHFILELLAEACEKVWASPTDYATLDKNLGEYRKFNNSWFIPAVFATLGGCFMFSGGLVVTLALHEKHNVPLVTFMMVSAIASIIGMVYITRLEKKLRSRVNWEQLDFFREVKKLLENVYNINNLIEIDSEEMLRECICADTHAIVKIIQKNKIENPETYERVRLKNLVNLIVRLGWMNTDTVIVFHEGSDGEKVIWHARADWLYGELFKQT